MYFVGTLADHHQRRVAIKPLDRKLLGITVTGENPHRVRELDWHFQLEGLSTAQAKFGADAGASNPADLAAGGTTADEADLPDDADEELDRPPADAKADPYEGLHDGPVDEDDIDDGPVDKDGV